MARILLPLAPGFEEIEAAAPIDVLRRLGYEVVVCGVQGLDVPSSRNLVFKADCLLESVASAGAGAIVLPGGLPGAHHLRDSAKVVALLREVHAAGGLVAAICAAPLALSRAGLLHGRKFTCYPGIEAQIPEGIHTGARIERDGNLMTGKGPGAALEFGLAVGAALGLAAETERLRIAMVA